MSSTCFEPESSSSGRQLYIQVWYVNILHHTCTCNCLPEDKPLGSKHVEDLAKY